MPFDGLQLGNYRLLRLIGSGGMGEVYLAEDIRTPRQMAVKIARIDPQPFEQSETLSDITRLFHREMQVIIALDHPNILPLIDFGETVYQQHTLLYIVMPYRPEGSLSNWLARQHVNEPLLLRDATALLLQAADALQHAHDHQVVHQDVKLANFLVREHQSRPRHPDLLLTDFGIARITATNSTQSLQFRGTPSAMPPEQWDGNPVPASDQYALAVMTYQLLTGRPPFTGGLQQVMRQHFTKQPDPPSRLNSRLPPAIDAVILRALAKSPEERFPSILAFAEAFQYLSNESSNLPRSLIFSAESTPTTMEPPTLPSASHVMTSQVDAHTPSASVITPQMVSQTPRFVTPHQTTIGNVLPQQEISKQEILPPKRRIRPFLLVLLVFLALLLIIPTGIIAMMQEQQQNKLAEQATVQAIQQTTLVQLHTTSTVGAVSTATAFAATTAATATAQANMACYQKGLSLGPYALDAQVYLLPSQAPWFTTSAICHSINVKFSQLTAPIQIQVCFTDAQCNAWVDIENTNQWYALVTNVPDNTTYRFGLKATQKSTIQFAVAD